MLIDRQNLDSPGTSPHFAARSTSIWNIAATLAFLGVSLLLLADSISNPHKTAELIGTPAYELIVPFFLVFTGLRLGWGIRLDTRLTTLITWVFLPILAILVTALTAIDANSPLNTAFTLTRLHQSRLGALALFWLGALILNQSQRWWKKHNTTVILLAPLVAYAIGLWVRWWPWNIFLEVVKENNIVENLQFLVLALTASWTATRAWYHVRQGRYLAAALAIVITFGLAFIAGDEVAWMQHHIGYDTPEALSNNNQQAEVTIHNLESVGQYMEYVYLLLTSFGTFSWLIVSGVFPKNWKHLKELVPQPPQAWYFAIAFVFILNNFLEGGGQYPAWSEPIELVLYAGLSMWIVQLTTRNLSRYLHPRT